MTEKEIKREVARIVREEASVRETLQRIQLLLQHPASVANPTFFRGTGFSIAKDESTAAFLYPSTRRDHSGCGTLECESSCRLRISASPIHGFRLAEEAVKGFTTSSKTDREQNNATS